MPNSCSAPGCKSNYTKEEHIHNFKMPEKLPEVRHAWIRALHREDIGHLKAVYVSGLYQLILSWQNNSFFVYQLIQISFTNSFNSFILLLPTHSTHSRK